jgi:hypothetical protein
MKTEIIEDFSFDSVVIHDIPLSDICNKSKQKLGLEKKIEEAEIFRIFSLIKKQKEESYFYRYFCCNGYWDSNIDCLDYLWHYY